ncbi:hypothetical protein SPFM15_00037 [Salmonella phage SPFM15]|nr:hypothetical protein SPFM5_00032 [Salmonella phage SPFM5]VFR13366.1 hypothetical protein SPFM14_00031 [Salmonella phage SPFM14]VFR13661.1 hypothetical protein SPFM15_00037 [Salmonella phage SPFM15]
MNGLVYVNGKSLAWTGTVEVYLTEVPNVSEIYANESMTSSTKHNLRCASTAADLVPLLQAKYNWMIDRRLDVAHLFENVVLSVDGSTSLDVSGIVEKGTFGKMGLTCNPSHITAADPDPEQYTRLNIVSQNPGLTGKGVTIDKLSFER